MWDRWACVFREPRLRLALQLRVKQHLWQWTPRQEVSLSLSWAISITTKLTLLNPHPSQKRGRGRESEASAKSFSAITYTSKVPHNAASSLPFPFHPQLLLCHNYRLLQLRHFRRHLAPRSAEEWAVTSLIWNWTVWPLRINELPNVPWV